MDYNVLTELFTCTLLVIMCTD